MGILRLLLALSVVAAHSSAIFGTRLVGPVVAVEAFYIISGFYMSLILNEKYIGQNNSYKLFLSNRFLRIFPIYWVVLLATVLICVSVVIYSGGSKMPKFDSYAKVNFNVFSFSYLIFTNIFLFGQDIVMFLGINPVNGHFFFTKNFYLTNPPLNSFLFVPQAWTLGVELTFYLIAIFIVRKRLQTIIILFFLTLTIKFFLFWFAKLNYDPWTYRFFPSELMFFLCGNLSYKFYLYLREKEISKEKNLLITFLIVSFTIFFSFLPNSYLVENSYFLCIALSIPFLFKFFKQSKLDIAIGELSYPVYISHLLIIIVCNSLSSTVLKSGTFIAIYTVFISILLNKFVAKPIERLRQRRIKGIRFL